VGGQYKMPLIQDLLARWRNRKEERHSFERQRNIEEDWENKRTSHYERELMRYREEERQKRIKDTVKRIRQQKFRETWSGRVHNLVHAPNIIRDKKDLFRQPLLTDAPNVFNKSKRRKR